MTDAKDLPDDNAAADQAAAESAAAEPTPREAELQLELAGVTEKLLRAMAETENVRRRLEQAAEDRGKYAVAGFAKDLLPVADNLRRALESIPADAKESDPLAAKLIEGVELTERALLSALERHGVKKVESVGQLLNPHLHQAMMEVEDPNHTAGTIVLEMQAGYTLNGRLIREAMVGVAKGGPKPGQGDSGVDTQA
ncbi:MAG TPA: nucleotide exchange factor GrpE [Magnetospirillaceae bacterium]|nr:nucleotide exchange factor GrpE [Magnetospirillaceae bacterium]